MPADSSEAYRFLREIGTLCIYDGDGDGDA